MKVARNTEMDSAISIASFVIERLHSEDLNVVSWLRNYTGVLDIAISKWAKPQKETLLHMYITDVYLDAQNNTMGKHFPIPVISEMQELLEYYGIDYSSVGHVNIEEYDSDDSDDELEEYAEQLQTFFVDKLLPTIVDDVFTVLFADKNFLHEFNSQCAEVIRTLKCEDYHEVLKADGEFVRTSYYPAWFRQGISYRDKLRCSICGCDLSYAFTTLTETNYDHIIPLKNNGNNDPTNWQLTCESCNKSKGARSSSFKNIIFPFWSLTE